MKKYPIDNSAILYLSLIRKHHTNIFRFTVTLTEPIQPELLQTAVNHVHHRFPTIFSGFRPGFFRYAQVLSEHPPVVQPDPGLLINMTPAEIARCAYRVYYLDKQIIIEDLRLRVNLDGNTPFRIKEVKTYQWEKGWKKTPTKYINQVQVQMFASNIHEADIVAYGLEPADYDNYLRDLDRRRLQEFPVMYDHNWIENVYLPKLRILADCLKRGVFPDV